MLKQPLTDAITVRFFMPSPALAPYVSTCYLTEVDLPEDETIEDWLHPEWANVRFSHNGTWQAAIGDEPLRPCAPVIGTGPTSHAAHFVAGSMRSWGIGLLPLGWARFVGADAAACANRFSNGTTDPVFARFAGLLPRLFAAKPDAAAEAARIDVWLVEVLAATTPPEDEVRIVAAHRALLDPGTRTVAELAERLAMSTRSLERLCLRAFGFSPKLLLRRQRFLRSLAQFMLDPSLTWISTLDFQYVDQAHFVRDFRAFMGMSPRRYASLEHPVLRAAARARAAAAGEAVQLLHRPVGAFVQS